MVLHSHVSLDSDGNVNAKMCQSNCFHELSRFQMSWLVWVPLILVFSLALYCSDTITINTHHMYNLNIITFLGPARERRLPQCIIIGVQKCGTKALLGYLDLHPHVETSEREDHFLTTTATMDEALSGISAQCRDHVPTNTQWRKAPDISLTIGRNPMTRLVSDYLQSHYKRVKRNKTHVDFETFVLDPLTREINVQLQAVQVSIYHQFFSRWFFVFPRNQIHIVDGENLIIDPVAEISPIEHFLGIEHRITSNMLYFNTSRGFYCMRINVTNEKCLGASKGRKHPEFKKSLMKILDDFFRPHNVKLFQMLNRRFNWS
ncbi:heparan sulfate glucosamine 3-O-sulfotransferase 5-like [Haliotis rufescens]|uniref:heparan sulfate glucosamine 3-O-sulfotransferase 5-like n=1 Tax=Haliotis rufescens TaxID=6454 RepID=UPI00201F257D|nr:heparan sulfate glucosamine 3-O-sulfotransferase 5-like [Haliotis rufescens]